MMMKEKDSDEVWVIPIIVPVKRWGGSLFAADLYRMGQISIGMLMASLLPAESCP